MVAKRQGFGAKWNDCKSHVLNSPSRFLHIVILAYRPRHADRMLQVWLRANFYWYSNLLFPNAASLPCEGKWSAYDWVMSKKRSLETLYHAEQLVYIFRRCAQLGHSRILVGERFSFYIRRICFVSRMCWIMMYTLRCLSHPTPSISWFALLNPDLPA